jgi:methylphosphotriester-DNA--protein-cysteine methyltransferase
MKIPERLLEDAFWELENEPDDDILQECQDIAGSKEHARQLYIKVRAMHFVMLEKKHRLEEARQLVITEELWDEMKKEL